MKTKTVLTIACCIVTILILSGCLGNTVCVDFEAPLTVGTQYGTPAGQTPGTTIFTTNGIPVSIYDFSFVGGGGTFNLAEIDNAPVAFGAGQSIRSNNINLEFAFQAVSSVTFDFLDLGGFENISVNGSSPIYAGELSAVPTPIGGVNVSVSTTPVAGGTKGTVKLSGTIDRLRIGGQEFWIDNVCAKQ